MKKAKEIKAYEDWYYCDRCGDEIGRFDCGKIIFESLYTPAPCVSSDEEVHACYKCKNEVARMFSTKSIDRILKKKVKEE